MWPYLQQACLQGQNTHEATKHLELGVKACRSLHQRGRTSRGCHLLLHFKNMSLQLTLQCYSVVNRRNECLAIC